MTHTVCQFLLSERQVRKYILPTPSGWRDQHGLSPPGGMGDSRDPSTTSDERCDGRPIDLGLSYQELPALAKVRADYYYLAKHSAEVRLRGRLTARAQVGSLT